MSDLRDIAGIPEADRVDLQRQLSSLGLLHDVVLWAHQQSPPTTVLDVVVQDEFTHDVVIPWRAPLYLVFSTT